MRASLLEQRLQGLVRQVLGVLLSLFANQEACESDLEARDGGHDVFGAVDG
jgi:hypothetical protein